ncbi:MAG TPA: hypothetical protein VLZ74_01185 [Methylocella sp.]|nr:hypothetical protein [Methylocella sp.]
MATTKTLPAKSSPIARATLAEIDDNARARTGCALRPSNFKKDSTRSKPLTSPLKPTPEPTI